MGYMTEEENPYARDDEPKTEFKMKTIGDIMSEKVKKKDLPKNLLHMF